ncbi:MAG: ribonuclease PH [Actinomycetota bacterium]|nr:ribonuclease PH [Actinomycetota bacterium]
MSFRVDGRAYDELRKIAIHRNYIAHAEGSVLIELGGTRVICTATVEEGKVPPFLRGSGQGWVTAEYSMLPRSTTIRSSRESSLGRVGGRTHEIQRLIGRSLRSVIDLKKLGELTIWIDADVIQADGGTRTAAITGSFVALFDAVKYLYDQDKFDSFPIGAGVAATSVGIVGGRPHLDLSFVEDSAAEVDMNVVMTTAMEFIEVQGTAESKPFNRAEFDELLNLAEVGLLELIEAQKALIGEDFERFIPFSGTG